MRKHGHAVTGQRSPTYGTWTEMRARTTNPRHWHWAAYGGRGITICERWSSFENFLADMGERPPGMTIDRIDNDGNYELGNCRWATPRQQSANTRQAKLTADDIKIIRQLYAVGDVSLRALGRRFGVSHGTIGKTVHCSPA